MNFIKRKINAIYTALGIKHEIESRPYRRFINQYFYNEEFDYGTTITYVKAFKKANKITIEIETHRPGILIGKAGVFINGLRKFLIEETKEDIKIDLRECKMWHNLYR